MKTQRERGEKKVKSKKKSKNTHCIGNKNNALFLVFFFSSFFSFAHKHGKLIFTSIKRRKRLVSFMRKRKIIFFLLHHHFSWIFVVNFIHFHAKIKSYNNPNKNGLKKCERIFSPFLLNAFIVLMKKKNNKKGGDFFFYS